MRSSISGLVYPDFEDAATPSHYVMRGILRAILIWQLSIFNSLTNVKETLLASGQCNNKFLRF